MNSSLNCRWIRGPWVLEVVNKPTRGPLSPGKDTGPGAAEISVNCCIFISKVFKYNLVPSAPM